LRFWWPFGLLSEHSIECAFLFQPFGEPFDPFWWHWEICHLAAVFRTILGRHTKSSKYVITNPFPLILNAPPKIVNTSGSF
jgi:hypothetical protein